MLMQIRFAGAHGEREACGRKKQKETKACHAHDNNFAPLQVQAQSKEPDTTSMIAMPRTC